jgi:hypothetical protein
VWVTDVQGLGLAIEDDRWHRLTSNGYVLVRATDFILSKPVSSALRALRAEYAGLPVDRYLPDGGAYRFRRYGAFRVSVPSGNVWPKSSRPYLQAVEVNAFVGGVVREFAPLDHKMRTNRFLTTLLHFNAACLLPSGTGSWHVDVHLVRVVARRDLPGKPAPEGIHRDGFDFVSIHLMDSQGVMSGGEIRVIDPNGTVLERACLVQPLDSIYIDDRTLRHDVTPIEAAADRGHRDVLLMSYQPEAD